MKKTDEIWVDFKEIVLKEGVSKIQENEMKLAFFAGMKSTLNIFRKIAESTGHEDVVIAYLIEIEQEVNCFFEQYIAQL